MACPGRICGQFGEDSQLERMRILVRNVLLVALLSGILLFLLEGGVRLLAPQQTGWEILGGVARCGRIRCSDTA